MLRAERRRVGLSTPAVAVFLLAVGVGAWAVRAAAPSTEPRAVGAHPTAATLADQAEATADEVVERYAALQRADGSFPDPVVAAKGDYGAAMLALAMLQRGRQDRDARMLSAGAAAIRQPAELPTFGAFELLAVARAYSWSERTLLGDPFAVGAWSSVRTTVGGALSTRGSFTANPAVISCLRKPQCYGNQKLVAGLAAQALLTTRRGAARRQALLADPAALEARVRDVARRIAAEVGTDLKRQGNGAEDGPGGVLSDPPRNPLAYHALSVMLLGDLVDALGAHTPPGVRAALRRAGQGLLRLTSPDGDLSYYGRGQGQVWVPAVTVAAAAQVAAQSEAAEERGAALAVAAAALARLRADYAQGRFGLELVPGAATAEALRRRGVDSYVSTRSYNGLVVSALDAAAPLLRELGAAVATQVPAATRGAVSGGNRLRLLALTGHRTWTAVSTDARNRTDARYGPGILTVRQQRAGGRWVAVVPEPPLSVELGTGLAIVDGGRRFVPHGRRTQLQADGSVVATGTWRDTASGIELPGVARWRWSITDGGDVQAAFVVPCRCTVVAGARMRGGARTEAVGDGLRVTDGVGSVQWSLDAEAARPVRVGAVRQLGASAYEPVLEERELVREVTRAGTGVTLRVAPSAR